MQIVEYSRSAHKYVKGILTILLILFYSSVFSQTKIDETKRKQFYEQWKIYSLDITKAEECGKKMLQLSQDDYERSLSYNLLAEKQLADLNYVKSIELLEKAQVYSKNIDSTQQYMRVTGTLISAYRKAGLILESDKNWELFQKLSENLPESSRDINLLFIRAQMFDVDKNHCGSANTREKFMNVAGKMLGEGPAKNTFVFAIMVQIVYDQIKCGKISEAVNRQHKVD